jgi:hypothetical protein
VIVLGSEKASNLSTTQFSSAEIKTNLNKNLKKYLMTLAFDFEPFRTRFLAVYGPV